MVIQPVEWLFERAALFYNGSRDVAPFLQHGPKSPPCSLLHDLHRSKLGTVFPYYSDACEVTNPMNILDRPTWNCYKVILSILKSVGNFGAWSCSWIPRHKNSTGHKLCQL